VRLASGEQLEGMRQDIDHGFNRLNGSSWGPGNVEDEALPYGAGDSSRQPPQRIHRPHGLGQPWGIPLEHDSGRLRRHVGGRKSRPAGRHDESGKGRRELGEGCGNRCQAVWRDTPCDDVEAVVGERVGERLAGPVLSSPTTDRFGDGEDFCVPRHGRNASGVNLGDAPPTQCRDRVRQPVWQSVLTARSKLLDPNPIDGLLEVNQQLARRLGKARRTAHVGGGVGKDCRCEVRNR
jgi:hypothetical protein